MNVMSKYRNRKVTVDGITFDSKREANRWCELKYMERAGLIKDLRRQVRYELIPSLNAGKKIIQRSVTYVADFVYWQDGKWIVEDAKGCRTDVYKLKKKLMRYIHGIEIQEY